VGGLVAAGDSARGQTVFEGKGRCTTCHGAGGIGTRMAPPLVDVGALRTLVEIERSILEPDADLHPDFRFVRAVTKSGETITGRLLNQDSFSLQVLDSKERLRGLRKVDLRDSAVLTTSPMPSAKGTLTPGEIADLVTYLSTLRGLR